MASAIDPEVCVRTGRLMTEWFEHRELTDADVEREACEAFGIAVEDRPKVAIGDQSHPQFELARKIDNFIIARRRSKWRNGMTQQEVAQRMDAATKMVHPDNYKFLDDATRERTGLEINPLWMMECLVRSGLLNPKEQVAALKELASYTHSKAPNLTQVGITRNNPEDWLMELAQEEYSEVEIVQPKQPVERGAGPLYESRLAKRTRQAIALQNHGNEELDAMLEEVEDWEPGNAD